jgi:hypothetical protein
VRHWENATASTGMLCVWICCSAVDCHRQFERNYCKDLRKHAFVDRKQIPQGVNRFPHSLNAALSRHGNKLIRFIDVQVDIIIVMNDSTLDHNKRKPCIFFQFLALAGAAFVVFVIGTAWGVTNQRLRLTKGFPLKRSSNSTSCNDGRNMQRSCLAAVCSNIYVRPNASCPRFLLPKRTKSGFGHQFTELLMGMRYARTHGLSYVFEPFGRSDSHPDDYSSMNDLLGLTQLFDTLDDSERQKQPTLAIQSQADQELKQSNTTCSVTYSISGYRYCSPGGSSNCFVAQENRSLFEIASPCFRMAALAYGGLFRRCKLRELLANTTGKSSSNDNVAIVWHIRYGDFTTHRPSDPFYVRTLSTLRHITEGYQTTIVLVGGGDGNHASHAVPLLYMNSLSAAVATAWVGLKAPHIFSPPLTFYDSFVVMAQADILIGSGSSLPTIAALVSSRPLYLAHVPKHGFNHGMEMLADSADMEKNGTVLESVRRLRVRLHARLVVREHDYCSIHDSKI